jgi:hypothetical protein
MNLRKYKKKKKDVADLYIKYCFFKGFILLMNSYIIHVISFKVDIDLFKFLNISVLIYFMYLQKPEKNKYSCGKYLRAQKQLRKNDP